MPCHLREDSGILKTKKGLPKEAVGLQLLGGRPGSSQETENKGAKAGKCSGDKNLSPVSPG